MACITDAGQNSQRSEVFSPSTELTLAKQQFAFVSSTAACRATFSRAGHDCSEAQAADGWLIPTLSGYR